MASFSAFVFNRTLRARRFRRLFFCALNRPDGPSQKILLKIFPKYKTKRGAHGTNYM